MYVGESSAVRMRHLNQYLVDGDHLRSLMERALADGLLIWRRARYVASKAAAQEAEARWLQAYDYAWNAKDNGGRKRILTLEQQFSCLCIASGVQLGEERWRPTGSLKRQQEAREAQGRGRRGNGGAAQQGRGRSRQQQQQFIAAR